MLKLPPSTAWSRFGLIFLGVGFVLILGMLWLVQHLERPHKPAAMAVNALGKTAQPATIAANASASHSPALPAAASKTDKSTTAQTADAKTDAARLSEAIGKALASLRDPAVTDKKAALDALRKVLREADPKAAISAIRQFLATREDAVTGLHFKVGQNGVLAEAPSLRTFMMDQLGTISTQAGTIDAAEVGRETLASMSSPDEWAVAMRNVAWADPQGSREFLAAKARELISYAPWQQLHSGGFLEAFDVIAYTGDPSFFNELAPMVQRSPVLQNAALVAMDRLASVAPEQTASYLNAHPSILDDHPMIRADYMGKVDLSAPDQRAQAEVYLQRPDVSLEEKSKFLARLGMPAGFASNNLLTPAQPQIYDIFARRELVNQTATTWLNSGQFPTLQAPLKQLITSTGSGG